MSFASMIAMKATENLVDICLMNGVISCVDCRFRVAAGLSMSAGFIAPLPYNYLRLKYGRLAMTSLMRGSSCIILF